MLMRETRDSKIRKRVSLLCALHTFLKESSALVQNEGDIDPATKTFVKSGSHGRSLDISRFRCYEELCGERGVMIGIGDQFEDPLKSGWQLIFVDGENNMLLFGDNPWKAFANNVWYVEIFSPGNLVEDGKWEARIKILQLF